MRRINRKLFTIVFVLNVIAATAYTEEPQGNLAEDDKLDIDKALIIESQADTADKNSTENDVSAVDNEGSAKQNQPEALSVSQDSKQEVPPAQESVPPTQQQTEKKVTAIEVRGNKSISTTIILSKIKTRIRSDYSTNIISDDIKRLNELGYFSDINIDTQDFEGGLKVFIIVTEKPLIEKIVLGGYFSRVIREEKLRETIKLREGQYLDEVQLKEDIDTIKDICVKKGYSNSEVTYKIDTKPDTNKTTLNIAINLGLRIRVRKIDIRGNKNFKTQKLLKLIKTRKAGLFSSGFYKEDLFKDDVERLKSFYRKNGYTDIKVDYETGYEVKKGTMFIVIRIEEGKKYIVGDILVNGNTVLTVGEIKKSLKALTSDKVFNQEGLNEDAANIQGIYFDKGYIFTQVKTSAYLNPKTDKVDVTYSIEEGIVGYVDKIKIRGNIKTKDVVIRRELRIFPGDRFDGGKLKRSKERLQNLGFFEEVSYDIEPSVSDEPNKRNLVVDVKESKTGEFSFGGGYSSVDKLIGFVEIAQKNFDWKNFPYFTGAGQDLRFRAEFGSISKNLELSFTEPWLFGYPLSFGFDAYRRIRDRETDVGFGYNEKRSGGDLRLGKELGEYLRTDTMYRIEDVDISSVSDDATSDLKKEVGSNIISSLQTGLTYDSRDNVFNPSKGHILSGTVELAGGPLGGDKDFVKLSTLTSKYFGFIRSSVLELRLRTGFVDAYGNSKEVPIYERFYAGGAYSIRGYHERKIGPIDSASKDPIGGEAMLVGNIEYIYPIIDIVKAALFYDVGNVWAKVDDFASGGYKSGVGLGVRLKTPIGPLRLDYGWPLNKEPGEPAKGKGRFHFSLSHGF